MKTTPAVLVIMSVPECEAVCGSAAASAPSACATSERTSETWPRGSTRRLALPPARSRGAVGGAVSSPCWWGWRKAGLLVERC